MKVKVRRKPIEFSAERFTHEQIPEGVYDTAGTGGKVYIGFVDTLEGQRLRAEVGDWIVTGVKGERWPVKPDIFDATYEVIGEG